MTREAVAVQAVSKRYGAVRAVQGLSLTVDRGQVAALVGPNGAGKSTVVNLLLGLSTPDAGSVQVLGGRPDRMLAAGRIGAMLQDGGLMPGVRVRALLELVRGMYRSPLPIGRLLADCGLTALAARRVERLSGGQAQRLRFAVALAGNPDLLVLDEPTAAMDLESRNAFWANLRSCAGEGRTVLFATHQLPEVEAFADRIVVLVGGRVIAEGTATQLVAAARLGSAARFGWAEAGTRVRFTLERPPVAGLDRLPGVTHVEVSGRGVTLRSSDAEATVRALLTAPFAAYDRVRDLEVAGPTLEDAVLALTRTAREESS